MGLYRFIEKGSIVPNTKKLGDPVWEFLRTFVHHLPVPRAGLTLYMSYQSERGCFSNQPGGPCTKACFHCWFWSTDLRSVLRTAAGCSQQLSVRYQTPRSFTIVCLASSGRVHLTCKPPPVSDGLDEEPPEDDSQQRKHQAKQVERICRVTWSQ